MGKGKQSSVFWLSLALPDNHLVGGIKALARIQGVWDSQRDAILHVLTSGPSTFISPSRSSLQGGYLGQHGTHLAVHGQRRPTSTSKKRWFLPWEFHPFPSLTLEEALAAQWDELPPHSLAKSSSKRDGKDHLGWLSHSTILSLQVGLGMTV